MSINKEQCGFTLVEVLVATAIAVILSIAVSSIVAPLMQLKTQISANSGLYTATMYFRDCVTNDAAWTNTQTLDASFTCVKASSATQCANASGATGVGLPVSLLSASSDPCLLNYNTKAGVDSSGLTKDGIVCTGFSETGNYQCPYRMNFNWYALCPSGMTSCKNPMIKVVGKMQGLPPDFYDAPEHKGMPRLNLDLDKFTVSVLRGRADQKKYFSLVETTPPPSGCAPNKRILRSFSLKQDPGNYVTSIGNYGPYVSSAILLSPGVYSCHITVPGYLAGNYKSALIDLDHPKVPPLLIGTSEFSPAFWSYNQTRSEIDGVFNLSNATNVGVAEWCVNPTTDPSLSKQTTGVPASIPGVTDTFTTMSCAYLTQTY